MAVVSGNTRGHHVELSKGYLVLIQNNSLDEAPGGHFRPEFIELHF